MEKWIEIQEKFIKLFKKEYDDEYESDYSDFIDKRVQLKQNEEFVGTITKLWLPKNIERTRMNNLWCVEWDNGKYGIIEINQIKFLD